MEIFLVFVRLRKIFVGISDVINWGIDIVVVLLIFFVVNIDGMCIKVLVLSFSIWVVSNLIKLVIIIKYNMYLMIVSDIFLMLVLFFSLLMVERIEIKISGIVISFNRWM